MVEFSLYTIVNGIISERRRTLADILHEEGNLANQLAGMGPTR